MPYTAAVFNVMIASPNDVATERRYAYDVVLEWNSIHSFDKKIVLMPVGWETHSSPLTGDRPQGILNKQILTTADLLIAIFWTRLGSPTGESPSGTVEEIEEHVKSGKPAMIYFSTAPVRLESVDKDQFTALTQFRDSLKDRGLYETFDSVGQFREKLVRQLALTVSREFRASGLGEPQEFGLGPPPPTPALSDEGQQLLLEASRDPNGMVMKLRHSGGTVVQTNSRNFVGDRNPRTVAAWEGAVRELCELSLLEERGHKGEVFAMTNEGYRVADVLSGSG